jgi:hypothetical protein
VGSIPIFWDRVKGLSALLYEGEIGVEFDIVTDEDPIPDTTLGVTLHLDSSVVTTVVTVGILKEVLGPRYKSVWILLDAGDNTTCRNIHFKAGLEQVCLFTLLIHLPEDWTPSVCNLTHR